MHGEADSVLARSLMTSWESSSNTALAKPGGYAWGSRLIWEKPYDST